MSANTAHPSVFRLLDDWYIVCQSSKLREKPLRVSLYGTPIAVFRSESGRAGALLDRCPHRNAPLSIGSIKGELLQCAYHGWQFDRQGICRFAAGIDSSQVTKACHAEAYPTIEQQGFVWVYAIPGGKPVRAPFRFPLVDEHGYTTVFRELVAEATIHAVAENALDVPHTAYLHGGLFRSRRRNQQAIEVSVTEDGNGVHAEYMGEQRPEGLAARLLAPGGGTITHFDRFILPSITQVEYKLGDRTHLCITSALTPVEDFTTNLYVAVSFKLPIPAAFARVVMMRLFLRIFEQDAEILKHQTENIQRFGGERFASTEADILGPRIHHALKMAEKGQRGREKPVVRTCRLVI
jgi:phenylpropionate dioxygenase-like ring-hydroxylating dioxygenase large terminal subunit